MTVWVNITGLTVGSYSATITVAATGASNTPQTVSVDLALAVPDYDGQWSGTTSQGRTISFTVVDNALTTYTVGFSFYACGGSVSGTRTTTFGSPVHISDGTFSQSSFGDGISGTLTSETTAVGEVSIRYQTYYPYYCTYTSTATWSATKQ